MIRSISGDNDIKECASCIRDSFLTVADELGITNENAPTNPAFMTYERLKESIDKGLEIFGLYEDSNICGCIGVEKSKNESEFYIERLAVLPLKRHKGYGKELMDFAFNSIKESGGKKASIAIVNENKKLKDWYMKYGFIETGMRKFEHLPFTVCFMEKSVD